MKRKMMKFLGIAMALALLPSCFAAGKWNKKSAISVISREDGSGTRGAFIELFGIEQKNSAGKKVDYTTDEATITNSTAVMLTSVASDKYAIGYVSLGSLNNSVKALKIDGVIPSEETIKDNTYKVQRPFVMVTVEGKPLNETADKFFNWALSSEAAPIISKAGAIPLV